MSNYFQSPEFKRVATGTTESAVKFSAKWIGIGLKAVLDFIIVMVKQAFGK